MGDPIEPVELRADGVLLRPWRPADAADVHRICQDPEIPRWTPVPSPYSPADATAFVAMTTAAWASGRAASWAICDADDGEVLGSVAVTDLDRPYPEVGYWVAPEARGRGVAAAAAREACRWAFDRGAPKVLWLADVGNEASWRVAHRVGFVHEGRRLAEIPHGDGPRTDAWVGSLLPGALDTQPQQLPYEPLDGVVDGLVDGLVDGDLTLRRWRVEDAARWVALNADQAVDGWSGHVGRAESLADVEAAIGGTYAEDFLLGRALRLAICVAGVPVGGVSLRTPNLAQGVGDMGWWLGRDVRGRGVGTRAVRLLAAWGLDHLGLRRISAGIHVDNAASLALAARVGFVAEGVRRQGAPAFGPGWGDAVAVALLPSDLHRAVTGPVS